MQTELIVKIMVRELLTEEKNCLKTVSSFPPATLHNYKVSSQTSLLRKK